MAYGLINKSGSEVWHGGLVKLRFDLFLEPDDARYDERYTYVPVIPEGGYPGKVDKDGNPKNNNVENLEWCTYSENTKHAYKTGLMPSDLNAGSKNGKSKLTTEEVLTIREIFSQIDKGKNYIRDIYKDLGEVFDIGFRELSRIIKRTHWKIEINEPNQIIDYRTQRHQKRKNL